MTESKDLADISQPHMLHPSDHVLLLIEDSQEAQVGDRELKRDLDLRHYIGEV